MMWAEKGGDEPRDRPVAPRKDNETPIATANDAACKTSADVECAFGE
jgi:hypothetical protein